MARTPPSPPDSPDKPEPVPEPPDPSLSLELFGSIITFQVRSAESNGAYTILEMALPATRTAPRIYAHPGTETFQILEGEVEFRTTRDGKAVTFRASAGDMVHIPPNVPHGVKNASSSPATLQIIIAPGSMEGYFLELGTLTTNRIPRKTSPTPHNKQHVLDTALKYDIDFIESD